MASTVATKHNALQRPHCPAGSNDETSGREAEYCSLSAACKPTITHQLGTTGPGHPSKIVQGARSALERRIVVTTSNPMGDYRDA